MKNELEHIDFDTKLKAKVEGHELNGTDELWSGVQKKVLASRYKRKFFFFRALSIVVILALISTIMFYEFGFKEAQISSNESIEQIEESKKAFQNDLVSEENLIHDEEYIAPILKSPDKVNLVNNLNEDSHLYPELNEILDASTTDSSNFNKGEELKTQIVKHDKFLEIFENNNRNIKSESSHKDIKTKVAIDTSKNLIDLNQITNNYLLNSNIEVDTLKGFTESTNLDIDFLEYKNNQNQISEDTSNFIDNLVIRKSDVDENTEIDTSSLDLVQMNTLNQTDSVEITIPNKSGPNRFALTPYISPLYSDRYLKVNSIISGSSDYISAFRQSETGKISYEFGLDLNLEINDKWQIISGVNYSNLGYQYNPQEIDLEHDTINDQFSLYSSVGNHKFEGEEFDEEGEQEQDEEDEISFKSKINLSVISVPLGIERYFNFNKHQLVVESSITFNYILSNALIINQINFEGEDQSNDFVFRNIEGINRFFVGARLGFGYQFNLNDKLALMVKPNVFVSFSELNSNAFVRSFPLSYGLKTGIKFSL